jgi:hypothetical protein
MTSLLEETIAKTRIHVDTRHLKRLMLDEPLSKNVIETLVEKHQLINDGILEQELNYNREIKSKQTEIEEIKVELESLKKTLQLSQKRKAERMEYDVIAKDILQIQSREKSLYEIQKLNHEIQMLQNWTELHAASKESRKEKVAHIISMIHHTQDELAQEKVKQMELIQEKYSPTEEAEDALMEL